MKPLPHIFFTITFSLFTLCSFAQHIPLPDSTLLTKAQVKNLKVNGLKEGVWGEYVDHDYHTVADTNSEYYRIGNYIHDTLQGKATVLIDDILVIQIPYVNGKKEGLAKAYFKYFLLIPYKNDKINGVLKKYEFMDSSLVSTAPFIDGVLNGTAKEYYHNGKIERETVYIKGKEVSDNAYDEAGKMYNAPFLDYPEKYSDSGFTNKAEAKNLTINGKKEGKWCQYSQVFTDCCIGKWDTTWSSFYTLTIYKHDKPIGIEREYIKDGVIYREITYDMNGNENGIEKEYYENGKLGNEALYKDGSVIWYKEFDENGNEIKQ